MSEQEWAAAVAKRIEADGARRAGAPAPFIRLGRQQADPDVFEAVTLHLFPMVGITVHWTVAVAAAAGAALWWLL